MDECKSFSKIGEECYLCITDVNQGNLNGSNIVPYLYIWYDQFSAGLYGYMNKSVVETIDNESLLIAKPIAIGIVYRLTNTNQLIIVKSI